MLFSLFLALSKISPTSSSKHAQNLHGTKEEENERKSLEADIEHLGRDINGLRDEIEAEKRKLAESRKQTDELSKKVWPYIAIFIYVYFGGILE
jgi:predicted  nucleic acid-binding Zn-ribbon protein